MTTVQKIQDIAEMVCDDQPTWLALREQVIAALILVHDDEPRAIDLMRKVLTTGSPQARAESREELRSMLGEITDAYVKRGKSWKADCRHITGPRMIEELMHTWSVYQMESEYPTGESSYALARKTSWALHSIGADQLRLTDYPINYKSWRGVAALAVSGASNAVHTKDELITFVKYAGKHPNLKWVLDIARDRNTIDAKMIEHVIKQAGTTDPLRRGTL